MGLDLPRLSVHEDSSGVRFLTDNALTAACGVTIGFTERGGGLSSAPYASLNLGRFAGEGEATARANICRLMDTVGAAGMALINPKQVHGTDIVCFSDECQGEGLSLLDPSAEASEDETFSTPEADGVLVDAPDVFALLCFADCVPLILVAPSGVFAVAHSGWRGTQGHIAVRALMALAQEEALREGASIQEALAACNVYIGPYIHKECFQVGSDVYQLFADTFGSSVLWGSDHVDLGAAIRQDLLGAGADEARIVDADLCTVCCADWFYSYRAEDGVCGRHGAFAFRK